MDILHYISDSEEHRNLRIRHRRGRINSRPELTEGEMRECCNDAEWGKVQSAMNEVRNRSHAAIEVHYGIHSDGMITLHLAYDHHASETENQSARA